MNTKFTTTKEMNNQVISYPQCIDNQAIPFSIYEKIIKDRSLNLESFLDAAAMGIQDGDLGLFWEFQKREYNRALIYSRKIVVNRAAFWNSPVLIRAILGNERSSLVKLLSDNVILPFLFDEKTFDEKPRSGFGIVDQGEKAMQDLICSPDTEVTCIKFDDDHDKHMQWVGKLDGRFHTEFTQSLIDENILTTPAMALLERNVVDEDVKELSKRLFSVSEFIHEKIREKPRRNGIYKEFIVEPGTSPEQGNYRSDKFTFQIKQWVDAVYNSNLPSMLGILTFTPYKFPTPYDLLVSWAYNPGNRTSVVEGDADFINEMFERTKSNIHLQKQWNEFIKKADLYIPDPHELTHEDIDTIRTWDEWQTMMGGLEVFLEKPTARENFMLIYNEFNKKLGSWYSIKKTASQVAKIDPGIPAVLVLYKFGKWVMGLLSGEGIVIPYSNFEKLPDLDKDQVRGIMEVGLLFINKTGVDWKRSQNMRQIKKDLLLKSEEIERLWKEIDNIKRHIPDDMLNMKKTLEITATNEDYV